MGGQTATKASTKTSAEGTEQRSQPYASQYVPSGPYADVLALQRSAGNRAVTQVLQAEGGNRPPTSNVHHTMAGGECEECSKKKRLGLQTKLTINEAGDIYEQEADRIADQVMATPAHSAVSGATLNIQRYAEQATEGSDNTAPASVDHVLAGSGRPLEPALRQDMEQRFGHDFSRVRLHTDPAAQQSARDVNAHAYTVGHNMVFGAGKFAPGTNEGRRLIAHELTHVVQQLGADANLMHPLIQRAPDPSKPATPELKARERVRAFRRGLTRAQELRQVGDRLIEEELGSRPVRRLGARRSGLAEIVRRGGPRADVARRLARALAEIEAELDNRAAAVVSVIDDLIESRLGSRPKTPRGRDSALSKLKSSGGDVGEVASGLERDLRQIEEELTRRQPGPAAASKFAKAEEAAAKGEKTAGKAAAKTEETAAKTVGAAAKAEEATTKALIKAEGKTGARLTSRAGRLGLSLLLPGPEDAIMLMVNFAGSYQEAWEIIEQRNTRDGLAFGIAAGMMGLGWDWVEQNLWRRFATPNVATIVIAAVGKAERAFNDGLVRGHKYGAGHPQRMKDRILAEAFTILAQEGYETDEEGLFTIDTVARVARVLMPIADDFLGQAAERKQAREKREKAQEARERYDRGENPAGTRFE